MKRFSRHGGSAFWLVGSALAQARPGGGNSYRSSSYSSGSSYRSSSSGSSYRSSSYSRPSGSSRPSGGYPTSGGLEPYHNSSYLSSDPVTPVGGPDGNDLFWTAAFTVVVTLFVVLLWWIHEQTQIRAENLRRSSQPAPSSWLGGSNLVLLLVAPLALLVTPLLFKISFALGALIPILMMLGILKILHDAGNRHSILEQQSHLITAEQRYEGKLDPLLRADPNFSLPVFREFAVLLYTQAMRERHQKFAHTRPYLSLNATRLLSARDHGKAIENVTVGCCHLERAWELDDQIHLRVRFESNYQDDADAYIAEETWFFSREVGLLTQPPPALSRLVCPGCGFAGEFSGVQECPQCQRSNARGQLDWCVSNIQVRNVLKFFPRAGEVGGIEIGTDLPTVAHPQLGVRRREFFARHPDFTVAAFQQKVADMFFAINSAWMARNWTWARPYLSDALFQTQRYWIDDYLRKGQVNRLEDIKLNRIDLSNVILDAYYESLTVRIFAQMRDFTVEEKSGQLISGDAQQPRIFSEYWTFIRRVGHKPSRAQGQQCPACAAPLDRINQAGQCEYCQSVITKGDFDWVLSNIEQDEVYQVSL